MNKETLSFTTRNIPTNVEERKAYLVEYYQKHIQGKTILNEDTGLSITFTKAGRLKATDRHNSIETTAVIKNILGVLKTAKYNNFGEPKPAHYKKFPTIQKFINFKCKVKVDDVIKNYRISCILLKGNKIHYDLHESSLAYAIAKGKV